MNPASYGSAFEPREVAFLQRFFDEVCAERGLAGGSTAASNLAAHIIGLYQQGVRDEKSLQGKLGAHTGIN